MLKYIKFAEDDKHMLEINKQALFENKPEGLRRLYDQHAATLLGFLVGVLKDHKLAEEYLIQLFSELAAQYKEMSWNESNSWGQLQKFAKDKLSKLNAAATDCEPGAVSGLKEFEHKNKYIDRLTDDQKFVFCEVYYHGKTIIELSDRLNKTEDLIRKTLKEAFAIIRKSGEN
jgi:DNA-directed RNA polymerase specialized sigma24 family protein